MYYKILKIPIKSVEMAMACRKYPYQYVILNA